MRVSRWLCAAVLIGSAATAAVPPERFTLQQSIDAYESAIGAWADYATETLTSTQGRYVLWNERSELWVALAPEFEPRQLTKHGDDVRIVDMFALPDGVSVLYVRARPGGERELWRANTETGQATQLASGADVPRSAPTFAPDSESFVVSEKGTIIRARITPNGLQRSRLLAIDDDRHANSVSFSEFTFSADGQRLAFVSQRKAGQSYVGVIDFKSGEVTYLDPAIHRDSKPSWSPDGQKLAFIRVPGNWVREHRFIDKTAAVPWSIAVWNVRSRQLRTAWRADAGRGSYVPPKLFPPVWTAEGRLVFAWEKTGWPLLYSVSSKGGVAALLTPGQGEIGRPRVDAANQTMVFESNHSDLGRSHLWRLSLTDGRFEQLTKGDSVEQLPGMLSTGDIVYFASERGRMPLRRVVRRQDGSTRALTPSAAVAKEHQSVWREFVDTTVFTVTAGDGVTSYHLKMQPRGPAPREGFPIIVICKGGPISRVLPGDRYGDYTPFAQYAVSRGYVVVFMNYRGSAGLGLDFRYPAERGATGASELLDLSALARHLKADARVNANAIGIMGYSYGGHLVGLALDKLPQDYRAGVHMSGIADWIVELKKDGDAIPEFVALSERSLADDLAKASSPSLEHWRAPILFTIGDADTSGHVEAVIDLGHRLLAKGVDAEFQLIPGATHGDLRSFPMARVYEFFERHLRADTTE
ncbi:prolyl oligopeptidase family serine peptidase [Steroidobacter sp.]|uniref:prolyl oligopeptidase family serine peptidase n=1 Tax=Steroidobacter sp. TaxID=1978227 RepID=UPI001A5B5E2D|nr:LpqB family beta-propeller domain-containing protein [Steroidobacter sp.]MBL8265975.1 S9 family peptidase [Steroidobacter sp.]